MKNTPKNRKNSKLTTKHFRKQTARRKSLDDSVVTAIAASSVNTAIMAAI